MIDIHVPLVFISVERVVCFLGLVVCVIVWFKMSSSGAKPGTAETFDTRVESDDASSLKEVTVKEVKDLKVKVNGEVNTCCDIQLYTFLQVLVLQVDEELRT